MPLILDHYDPDQLVKDRARRALVSLGLVGRDGPIPEVPSDDEPIRAALARKRYRMKRRNP